MSLQEIKDYIAYLLMKHRTSYTHDMIYELIDTINECKDYSELDDAIEDCFGIVDNARYDLDILDDELYSISSRLKEGEDEI